MNSCIGLVSGKARLLLAGIFMICSVHSLAQTVPVPNEQDDSQLPETARTALELSQELERHQRAIADIVNQNGIYAAELVEAYGDLARLYKEQEDHKGASETYKQALQITRINNGLNSARQIPVLSNLIGSYIEQGDWPAVDSMQHLKFYVAKRSISSADPEFVEAVTEYGEWKLRVLRENLLREDTRSLNQQALDISDVYTSSIAAIEAQPNVDEPSLIPLLDGKLQADMAHTRYLAATPYHYFQSLVSQYITENVCQTVRDPQGNLVRSCVSVQRVNPRYAQSQQDTKRIEVTRSIREVDESMDRLKLILLSHPDLPPEKHTEVQSRINELEQEYMRLARENNRVNLF